MFGWFHRRRHPRPPSWELSAYHDAEAGLARWTLRIRGERAATGAGTDVHDAVGKGLHVLHELTGVH